MVTHHTIQQPMQHNPQPMAMASWA
jgi:hypothetical protein